MQCSDLRARTTDTQWRHESKKSENLGQCGRQNMLQPYLRIWDWDWIFGCAVKAIFSPGVRSSCLRVFQTVLYRKNLKKKLLQNFFQNYFNFSCKFKKMRIKSLECSKANPPTYWSNTCTYQSDNWTIKQWSDRPIILCSILSDFNVWLTVYAIYIIHILINIKHYEYVLYFR